MVVVSHIITVVGFVVFVCWAWRCVDGSIGFEVLDFRDGETMS